MRTETVTRVLYTAQELQEHDIRAYYRAIDDHASDVHTWADHSDEWGSLASFDGLIGYRRDDRWNDWDNRGLADCATLVGRRAWAWLENVVLEPKRIRWAPITSIGVFGQDRRRHARYGQRPGTIPDCPFTGFHVDELILDSLRADLRASLDVGQAVRNLEGVIQSAIDEDLQHQCSEDGFLEWAHDMGIEFDAEGRVA